MRDYKSLSHTRWDCKYHVVFIPKRRKKLIYGDLRTHLGEIFHDLANRKGIVIEEGHLMRDHVHMCISVPPKYAVPNIVGYLKGKSAIAIAPWALTLALRGRHLISLRLCRRSFNWFYRCDCFVAAW